MPPQSISLYRALLKARVPMTADKLAMMLRILRPAAYRATKPLVALGCIEAVGRRPVRFRAKPPTDALNAILIASRVWFSEAVAVENGDPDHILSQNGTSLKVSFITSRQDLFDHTNRDTRSARRTLNLIVSGLEVPAETILENKLAIDRGVVIRILVQRQNVNKEMLTNWERLGSTVRLCPLIDTRIITVDDRIVYLISYNPNEKEEGVGVRFDYPPITHLMNELFEQKWGESARGVK